MQETQTQEKLADERLQEFLDLPVAPVAPEAPTQSVWAAIIGDMKKYPWGFPSTERVRRSIYHDMRNNFATFADRNRMIIGVDPAQGRDYTVESFLQPFQDPETAEPELTYEMIRTTKIDIELPIEIESRKAFQRLRKAIDETIASAFIIPESEIDIQITRTGTWAEASARARQMRDLAMFSATCMPFRGRAPLQEIYSWPGVKVPDNG